MELCNLKLTIDKFVNALGIVWKRKIRKQSTYMKISISIEQKTARTFRKTNAKSALHDGMIRSDDKAQLERTSAVNRRK